MKWEESKHPRDSDGRFSKGGSESERDNLIIEIEDEKPTVIEPSDVLDKLEPKIRTVNKSQVIQSDGSYLFPVNLEIKLGKNKFQFNQPISVHSPITIFPPNKVREQTNLTRNYGGRYGGWSKKAGDAFVEISGGTEKRQVHWFENTDGTIAAVKIVLKFGG